MFRKMANDYIFDLESSFYARCFAHALLDVYDTCNSEEAASYFIIVVSPVFFVGLYFAALMGG